MKNETMHRRQRMRGRRGLRAGNSIIEFAIAFSVLMWLSMGMVEFGEFFYIRHAFEAAARDGCRVAVMQTATQAQVVAAMTRTLLQANVAYNNSWLTMSQYDLFANTTTPITDVSTVPFGDEITITLATTYGALPQGISIRPLYAITGGKSGIATNKAIGGQATYVKE
jgi:Flp pilus assembly protein TadG